MPTDYNHDPVQTAIAVAYRNARYISDKVLPRTPVPAEKFRWNSWPIEDVTAIARADQADQAEDLLARLPRTAAAAVLHALDGYADHAEPAAANPAEIGRLAALYQAKQAALGIRISIPEAVAHVTLWRS